MPSATASGADASKGEGARNRDHKQGNQERKYTAEQAAAVLRIRRCRGEAFYEILELAKTCSDVEIKKAYRKQSLLTHPDKNGHEHADEAFKMVSRAFGVLGDKDKRKRFDQLGTDPDSRFASAQAQNPFAGFANRGGAGRQGAGMDRQGMWEDQMSPEEMFQRFFAGGGGGLFGGGFDTGPGFVFNMGGGPGIRVHQFGGARPRRRPREGEAGAAPEQTSLSSLISLLPIILFFIFPLIQSIFNGGGSSQPTFPNMAFDKAEPPYTHEVITRNGVKFYVTEPDWKEYDGNKHKMGKLQNWADVRMVRNLDAQCNREQAYRQRLAEEAQGWFFQDPIKMEEARTYPMPSCERLHDLQRRVRSY